VVAPVDLRTTVLLRVSTLTPTPDPGTGVATTRCCGSSSFHQSAPPARLRSLPGPCSVLVKNRRDSVRVSAARFTPLQTRRSSCESGHLREICSLHFERAGSSRARATRSASGQLNHSSEFHLSEFADATFHANTCIGVDVLPVSRTTARRQRSIARSLAHARTLSTSPIRVGVSLGGGVALT
jgi:hypothetical protein